MEGDGTFNGQIVLYAKDWKKILETTTSLQKIDITGKLLVG